MTHRAEASNPPKGSPYVAVLVTLTLNREANPGGPSLESIIYGNTTAQSMILESLPSSLSSHCFPPLGSLVAAARSGGLDGGGQGQENFQVLHTNWDSP